jgi:deoxyribonuclease IV
MIRCLPMMIGRHLGLSQGLAATPRMSKSIGYDIFQIFLGVPQQVISKPKSTKEIKDLAKALNETDQLMVIHASYTINLCHPPDSSKAITSVKSLVQDLKASELLGERCLGVIIHMGKNIPANGLDEDQALSNYRKGLRAALRSSPPETTIILETGAGQGSEVGTEIEGLAKIYHGLSEEHQSRITFCIDTCHIWAAGYDISSTKGVKSYFDEFDQAIGIDKISCIHFNNSKTPCGSCVDRHDDLNYGLIDPKGLRAVARFACENKIPLVMETPLDAVDPETNQDITHEDELALVRSWLD